MNVNDPRVKVFVTLFLGLALLAGTVVMAYRLADQTAPEDTAATGFGVTATRDLFGPVAVTFKGIRCETMFNTEHLKLIPHITEITSVRVASEVAPFTNLSKYCEYDIGGGRSIVFSLTPYSGSSEIDLTRDQLYTRVNGLLLYNAEVFAHDNWFDVDYFLGDDALDNTACRTNLFHFQNDFEFASIQYKGFNDRFCLDQNMINLNDAIASVFSENIAIVMDTINIEYGVTFEDLFLDYDLD